MVGRDFSRVKHLGPLKQPPETPSVVSDSDSPFDGGTFVNQTKETNVAAENTTETNVSNAKDHTTNPIPIMEGDTKEDAGTTNTLSASQKDGEKRTKCRLSAPPPALIHSQKLRQQGACII